MQPDHITQLVAHGAWAMDRVLGACGRVSAEEFIYPIRPDPGWGSLRGILVHTLDADYGWRVLLEGEPDAGVLDEADFSDVATLRARWAGEQAAWKRFVAGLTPERLAAGFGDQAAAGPRVWQTVFHVVLHGAQHRSEAAAILTGLGQSPGELDFIAYLRAERS